MIKQTYQGIKNTILLLKEGYFDLKWRIFLLTVLGTMNSVLEGVGITALIPIFSLMVGKENRESNFVLKLTEQLFSFLGLNFKIETLLIFVLSLFILKFIIDMLVGYLMVAISVRYQEDTMRSLFSKMLNASWSTLMNQKLGYLDNLCTVNVKFGRMIMQEMSSTITLSCNVLIYTTLAFSISPKVTSLTLFVGFLVLLFFRKLVSKIQVDSFKINRCGKKISHGINEKVVGMKMIKIMSVMEEVKIFFYEYFHEWNDLQIGLFVRKKIGGSVLQLISVLYVLGLFLFFYRKPDFSIAVFVVMVFLVQRIFEYIKQAQQAFNGFSEALPYLKNILEYKKTLEEGMEVNSGTKPFEFKEVIKFENVYFTYQNGREILSGVNFSIRKGDMVGLVGPSGSGKTTVVDLFLRLLDVSSGCITVDGEDVTKIDLYDWRKNIGYVSQDIFLLNGSIADNIRFFDDSMGEDVLVNAAKMANIYDFIISTPDGFSTQVGERGVLLSVGQRQRISIARALARKPLILILDEATSALDRDSEIVIQEVIGRLKNYMTIIIIAHRLTTVMESDKIFVIDGGKVVEEGPPNFLLMKHDSYLSRIYKVS